MKRPKPLADLVGPAIGPALAAQGFTGLDVVASWADIVGDALARRSQPVRVEWPRRDHLAGDRKPEPGTLVVRVDGAFALDLQHLAPQVIERVNAFYGWRCVGRLVLKQAPVGRHGTAAPARPAATDKERARAETAVEGLDPGPLRDALLRLGLETMIDATTRHRDDGTRLPQSS